MKSALVSSCLVSAALAAPFASRAGSTTIQMKTGDGDASVQVTVPFDTVFSTANDLQAQVGVNAVVIDAGPTCHAFSDNAALQPLGNDFNNTVEGVFTNGEGAGEVGSSDQGVSIGAFFCSNSKAAVDAQVAKGSSPPSSSITVRIENIFDNNDTATQLDIPIDVLVLTANTLLGNLSDDLSIVSATGVDVNTVSCQAFTDPQGNQAVGNRFTVQQDALLSPNGVDVTINAIKCVSQWADSK